MENMAGPALRMLGGKWANLHHRNSIRGANIFNAAGTTLNRSSSLRR